MRLFIGIPMAAQTIHELSELSERLKPAVGGLRWTAPESWHITLQFLGETSALTAACVRANLHEVRMRPIPVHLDGVGFFDRAGIFHAAISVTPELVQLQRKVVEATGRCGFAPEKRSFHPHITLARAKGERHGRAFDVLRARIQRQPVFSGFTATEFLLYESFLRSGGAQYEVRERFSLEAGRE